MVGVSKRGVFAYSPARRAGEYAEISTALWTLPNLVIGIAIHCNNQLGFHSENSIQPRMCHYHYHHYTNKEFLMHCRLFPLNRVKE